MFCLLPAGLLRALPATAEAASGIVVDLPPDDATYTAGTRAMDESRWSDAVSSFDRVVQAKSARSDAALYWKAYALLKLGKPDLAVETCVQLRTQFAASSWNRDCAALKLAQFDDAERRAIAAAGQGRYGTSVQVYTTDAHTHSHDSDADLKILAINSLLHRDPAQAIPLLRSMLTGDQPTDVKRHALFVLAQSRSPEAESAMRDLLQGKAGPELQSASIQAAGVYEGRRLNDTLVEVYKGTADTKVKRSIISAFFVSNDDVHLVELARAEKSMELKRSIVSQLSLMNGKAAGDYMLELLK